MNSSDSVEGFESPGDQVVGDSPPRAQSLARKALRGSAWTLFGQGADQGLRMVGHVIMTRLLFPEAFALMGIVNAFLQGAQTLSGIGINASIVHSKRGEEPVFLHTAWTVHIVRGAALWIISILLAWPVAAFYDGYDTRLLAFLLIAGAANILVDGVKSMNFYGLTRNISLGAVTTIELVSRVAGIGTMIAWAAVWPTVWAFIGGALVTGGLRSALTHLFPRTPRMRFAWERAALHELITFGKWILLGGIATYIISRIDHLVVPKLMAPTLFGIYVVASRIPQIATETVSRISQRILFPFYARTAQDESASLRREVYRSRLILLTTVLPPLWAVVIFSQEIVGLLYDDRYAAAGYYLAVLSLGALFNAVLLPVGSVLLAVGDSFRHTILNFVRSAVIIIGMTVGGAYFGVDGVIWGYVIGGVLYYPFMVALVRPYNAWFPGLDFAALGLSAIFAGGGLWLRSGVLN